MLAANKKTSCFVCGGDDLKIIMDVADQPLSRYGLVKIKNSSVKKFPILIAQCSMCTHMQNIAYVEGTVDYTDQEIKESRTYSDKMRLFLENQASYLKGLHTKEKSISRVLEVGCGDGYFLSQFNDFAKTVGFEPSPEGALAREKGVFLYDTYFEADKVKDLEGFDIAILRQVLEHINDPKLFINLLKKKILRDGLLYLEVPNGAKSIYKNRFHDFYYEHVSYFTKSSLIILLERENFEVISCRSEYDEEIITVVARYQGDKDGIEFQNLTEKINSVKEKIQEWLKEGKKIVGWGTAGNGSLFFSLLAITDREVEFVVDSDKRKQGLYLPITNQKVISPEYLIEVDPDVVIVLSQFHSNEIIKEAKRLVGDKIIVNFFD